MAKSKKTKQKVEPREEELAEDALDEDEDDLDEDEDDLDEDEDDLDEDEDEGDEDDEDDEDEDLDDDQDDEDEDELDEDEDEDDDVDLAAGAEQEDPYWWTPHLALFTILLISLLGFFGLFNPYLGFLAAHPAEGHGHDAHAEAPAAAPTPAPAPEAAPAHPTPTADPRADVMGAKHILVSYKGAMRAAPTVERSKEEAQKRAEEVAAKAKKLTEAERNEAWGKLVEEYSDEGGAARRGGDLGRFRKGSFHKDFVAGTEKLKVGEIGGPVESPFGFHIIWRTF